MLIGAQNVFLSAEGADQHEQRRLGQVEVREHGLEDFEFEAWIDEQVCGSAAGEDSSRAGANRMFEGADGGGADGDDAPRFAESVVDSVGSCCGDGIRLGVEFVIFDAPDANGLKSPEADVKSDLGGFDSTLTDALENFRGEVKAGGGSGDGAARIGIDGLITIAVTRRIGAGDVGRERDVADAIEGGEEICDRLEADAALAKFCARQNFGLQFVMVAEEEVLAYADFAAGTDEAFPVIGLGGELASEQHFDAAVKKIAGSGIMRADRLSASASAAAVKPGGKDASVVEHDQIARPQ